MSEKLSKPVQNRLDPELFSKLFPLLLTDRGSEFEKYRLFELDQYGKSRLNIFYCDAMQSNARSETAFEKRTFSAALQTRRCVIPSTGFYEWAKPSKEKYLFNLQDSPMLYMAGLYTPDPEGLPRYVILTTAANNSMKEIHDRMPVLLRQSEISDWNGAAWHKAKALDIPHNIDILPLPPYTPEMNPIEQIWKEIRKREFKNEIFSTLEKVVDRLCDVICSITPYTIASITARDWIVGMF